MVRHPAAATWVPLLALLLLAGLSAVLTHEAPKRPGARLLAAVEGFCEAIADGEYEAALDHLAADSRSALNAQRLAQAVEQHRGSPWMVLAVDPERGTTTIAWGGAISDDVKTQDVLRWVLVPAGDWKLVL